jgi:hypothetical protein
MTLPFARLVSRYDGKLVSPSASDRFGGQTWLAIQRSLGWGSGV